MPRIGLTLVFVLSCFFVIQREIRADDPHLLLWLDASDQNTLHCDADNLVLSWENKAKRASGAFESEGDRRPRMIEKGFGGKPAVRFDGVNDLLRNISFEESAKQWTLLIVATPRSNSGYGVFRAFFSSNRRGQNDYTSGMNVDMGPSETYEFSELNFESAKDNTGVRNLRTESSSFGEGVIVSLVTDGDCTQLHVGHDAENMRFARATENSLQEVRIGARFFENAERGYFDGDISEILFFDTPLEKSRLDEVIAQLAQKYGYIPDRARYSLEAGWEFLRTFDGTGSRRALDVIDREIRRLHEEPALRESVEKKLVAVLESDSPVAAKDFACRRLVVVGTEKSVPALAAYLPDARLGTLAQMALQAIASEASLVAFREALTVVPEKRQLALIASLGWLRDTNSVPLLVPFLKSENEEIVYVTLRALSRIGDAESAKSLATFLQETPPKYKKYMIDASLDLVFCLLEQGQMDEAAALLAPLRSTADEASKPAILTASILLQPKEAAALLFEAFSSDSPSVRGRATALLCDIHDETVLRELISHFSALPPVGKVALLEGLPFANPVLVREVLAEALKPGNSENVQLAALSLLGCVGNEDDVTLLIRLAVFGTDGVRVTAFENLLRLRDSKVDVALVGQLNEKVPELRCVSVKALLARRAESAFDSLVALVNDPDDSVQTEAGKAIRLLAKPSDAGQLLRLVLNDTLDKQHYYTQALIAACMKVTDPDERADVVLQEYEKGGKEKQVVLLPILGALGGKKVKAILDDILRNLSDPRYDSAVFALASWPNADVVAELIAIAEKTKKQQLRAITIRGVARVAPRPGQMPPAEAFEVLHKAFKLADSRQEKSYILTRMSAVRTPTCLAFAVQQMDDGDFSLEAINATAELAEGMKEAYPKEAKSAFERLLKISKDDVLNTKVRKLLEKM